MDQYIDVQELIEAVQARQAIWDMCHRDYSDKAKRKQCWDEILDIFAIETATESERKAMGECLQKKWKNVRDRYAREVKLRKGSRGDTFKRPYIYFEQLTFLEDMIENGRSNTSHDESEVSLEFLDEEQPGPSEKRRTHKRPKQEPVETLFVQGVSDSSARDDKREVQGENDNRLFLLSLLPAMEFIPPHKKLITRVEIMQVINKYSAPSS